MKIIIITNKNNNIVIIIIIVNVVIISALNLLYVVLQIRLWWIFYKDHNAAPPGCSSSPLYSMSPNIKRTGASLSMKWIRWRIQGCRA